MDIILIRHPEDCRELNESCPNLIICDNKRYIEGAFCNYTCNVLEVKTGGLRGKSLDNNKNVTIKPLWECPYWIEGRKQGLYPKVQARIENGVKVI